jgi:hypothetical protein
MIPMRNSSIFRSRWMALLWAGGILWFAYDFAGPADDGPADRSSDVVQLTDANGAPVSPDEAKRLEEALNRV